jgi:hypothetical protein
VARYLSISIQIKSNQSKSFDFFNSNQINQSRSTSSIIRSVARYLSIQLKSRSFDLSNQVKGMDTPDPLFKNRLYFKTNKFCINRFNTQTVNMPSRDDSFIQSNPTPQSWDRESAKNFQYTQNQLIDALKGDKIATITVMDHNSTLQTLYSPMLSCDDHGTPNRIFGSLEDSKKTSSFAFVAIESLGLYCRVGKDVSDFSSKMKLTKDHLKGSSFGPKSHVFAEAVPNFIALPFGETPPDVGSELEDGDLSQIESSHGSIVSKIVESLYSAEHEFMHSKQVLDNIITLGDESQYISPVLDDDEVALLENYPFVILSHTKKLPEDVKNLRDIFKVPPTPPTQQNPAVTAQQGLTSSLSTQPGQIVIVNQDSKESSEKDARADKKAAAKRSLFNICGIINTPIQGAFGAPVSISDFSVPQLTPKFQEVLQKKAGPERNDAFRLYLQSGMRTAKDNLSPFNLLSQHDMEFISPAFATAELNSNYHQSGYDQLPKSGNKQLNINSFGPQSLDATAVESIRTGILTTESERQNDVSSENRSKQSIDIPSFNPSGSVDEVKTTFTDFYLVKSFQYDLDKTRPLVLHALGELLEVITSERSWIDKHIEQMPWLACAIVARSQSIISGFAKFSENYRLLEDLQRAGNTTQILRNALTSNDIQEVTGNLMIARSFANDVRQAKMSTKALSAESHMPSFYRNKMINPAAPPVQEPVVRGGKRPVSASAERQSNNRSGRYQQSTIAQPPFQKKPMDKCGMLYLYNPDLEAYKVFPKDLEVTFRRKKGRLCSGFCCQGKVCEQFGSCNFIHVSKYDDLSQSEFDMLCAYISENKHAWLSDGMLKKSRKIKLNPQYEHLRGDESGPFTSQNEG